MKCPQKKIWFLIFFLALLLGLCFSFSASGTKTMKRVNVVFKNTTVSAEVADTPALEMRGLSGRKNLANGSGMWFAFPTDTSDSFWMKEMNFSLDMIWFDKDFKIVYIKENATPKSYPELFGPQTPYRYVLEVPAGFVQKNSVLIGDTISVK